MDVGSETASNNDITDIAITAVPITSSNMEVTTTTENSTSKLKIIIKISRTKKNISIDGSSTVKQLKDIVVKEFNLPINQICLTYSSKILNDDDDNINKYDIKDGVTINLVKQILQTNTTTSSASASSTIPKGTNDTLVCDNQTNTTQLNIMNNPVQHHQVIENSIVQNVTSNSDLLCSLLHSNPQMRNLMKCNLETSYFRNNRDLLRQKMESARNLTILQELMRTYDRILRNSESTPDESNDLQRINDNDVQKPIYSAPQKPFDINLFSQLFTGNEENTTISCMENTNPLSNSSTSGGTGTTAVTTASNRQQETTDTSKNQQQEQISQTIKNYISQLDQNVHLIQDVVNKPCMQSLMNSIATNPDIPRQMVANNPKLYAQIIDTLSATMKEQMRNLDVQALMKNDQVHEAIIQVQKDLKRLHAIVPNLFGAGGLLTGKFVQNIPTSIEAASAIDSDFHHKFELKFNTIYVHPLFSTAERQAIGDRIITAIEFLNTFFANDDYCTTIWTNIMNGAYKTITKDMTTSEICKILFNSSISSTKISTLERLIQQKITVAVIHLKAEASPQILDSCRTNEYATTTPRPNEEILIAINPLVFDKKTTGDGSDITSEASTLFLSILLLHELTHAAKLMSPQKNDTPKLPFFSTYSTPVCYDGGSVLERELFYGELHINKDSNYSDVKLFIVGQNNKHIKLSQSNIIGCLNKNNFKPLLALVVEPLELPIKRKRTTENTKTRTNYFETANEENQENQEKFIPLLQYHARNTYEQTYQIYPNEHFQCLLNYHCEKDTLTDQSPDDPVL
ncbi:unnamed protein product [Rotaria sordida]|uniref:Ubiquitin-like domain-containing protein n=1 Tax=Rotaria sordida TaxID=392033 RepID=A0A819L735_9BILA|nr:unnamed protein product [Rotaria sordida]